MFTKITDYEVINAAMKNKDTECVLIEHKNPEAGRLKILGCVVFRTFEKLPFDTFV